MGPSSIAILGGDLRQCYTAEYLYSSGWKTVCYHTPAFPYHSGILVSDSLTNALERSEYILLPSPLTRDKVHLFQSESARPPCSLDTLWKTLTPGHTLLAYSLPDEVQEIVETAGCSVRAFGGLPCYREQNCTLTAEGLLAEVIRRTPFALSSAAILLLGYGGCGAAIGKLFLMLCKKIYLIEQKASRQKEAGHDGILSICKEDLPHVLPDCRLIINTIPAPVLNMEELSQAHSSCHIFDIASAPFGFPPDTTEQCLLPYYRLPGIPGRFSPVTAGEMAAQTIERMTAYDI